MIYDRLKSKLNFCLKDIILLLIVAALGLIALWSRYNFDQRAFSSLRQNPLDWDDLFWLIPITHAGKAWFQIWLISIWFVFKRSQHPVLIALLGLLIVFAMVVPLKVIVGRPRPYEIIKAEQNPDKQLELDSHTSFPSGDTAVAFAIFAVIVYLATWPWVCVFLAISAVVALLRLTAMAHYPSDILAGAAIGILAGLIAVQIDRRWLPLKPPRFDLKLGWAISAIIIIPILIIFSEGLEELPIFIVSFCVVSAILFLHAKNSSITTVLI
jgi:undecaprenyl-diphosphatase